MKSFQIDMEKIFICILTLGIGVNCQGPVFLLEPPARLTFSNTTGSQVSCAAHGSPPPKVEWLLQDGTTVASVPGLRQSLGNGTLYFPPFRAVDYRKDVHLTVYRCRASNSAGTIISREVHVRGVVNQPYEVQVYHSHVIAGNTAVLGCIIPASVKDHVTVTSWSRDDSILLQGSNMGGRLIVTYGTGELHIRSARAEDSIPTYTCLTIHILTQERKRSQPALLTVTDPTVNFAPRLAPSVQTMISVERDTDIHLTCSSQGNPPPTFNWYREIDDNLEVVLSSVRFHVIQDMLFIRTAQIEDTGRFICKVTNGIGEEHLDIHLTVNSYLNVHILPQLQVINSGESAIFNCTVTGSPVGVVQWLKNGEILPIDGNGRIKLLNALVLVVSNVTRHDKGMYQCMVHNERESAQGSAELRLGDIIPELQNTFIEQAMRPGSPVTFRCSATGSPPPQFQWLLDGEPLTNIKSSHRYAISQYVDHFGDVISHFNISNARVEDGGLYSCKAVNSLGATQHSARLNIYGPPFVRAISPIKAVAGADVTLHCPYSGHPIESIGWERHEQKIMQDLRHHLGEGGSLTVSRLDPTTDSGFYACSVINREGNTARRDIQLVVLSPPIIEPFTFSNNLQEGARAHVTCSVTSGDLPIHFAWTKNGASIPATLQVEERTAEFYSMLVFKRLISRHSGSYTCIADNLAAKANYTAKLMVKVAPQWVVQPRNVSTLLGNPLLIECSAKGFPEPQITWLKGQGKSTSDYQPVPNLNNRITLMANGSLWLENVSPLDEGHYLCRATNGIGPGLGKVIYVGVNEPARFDLPTENVAVKYGDSANLICQVYGDSPLAVIWTFDGNRLDFRHPRYSITNLNTDNGLNSQITISKTNRRDTGIYKCLAENAFGYSEHIVNLAVQERPDPPTMLEVVEVFSRSVRLTWKRSFDGNSPINAFLFQYQFLRNPSIQTDWERSHVLNVSFTAKLQPAYGPPVEDEAILPGLKPATVYRVRMIAINSIGYSDYTSPIIVKTQQEQPSEPPKDVKVEAVSPADLYLSWTMPPRESWNGELLGYTVSWKESDSLSNYTKSMTIKGWGTNKFHITGLKKFTRYSITVRAFNSVSDSPSSPTIIGTTKEGVPEAPPSNISCSEITSQIMKISWMPPPPNLHGGVLLGYKVYYAPLYNDLVDIPTIGEAKRTTSTETYLHTLYKFTNYSIKVLAYTGAGDGVMSEPLYCLTEEDLPGPPAKIKAAALTSDSIVVSWLAPNKANGRIILYTIYCRESGHIGTHVSYNTMIDDETVVLYGVVYEVRHLKEHCSYEFWVSATTSVGEGEASSIVSQATNTRAPSKIASFTQVLHKPDKSHIVLPCVAIGNPKPRTMWIFRDRPITFSNFYEITDEGHLKIDSVDPSLAGNYTCSAQNIFGTDVIAYTLVVLMPPSAPTLDVQFTTTSNIRLHWTHPENGGTVIQGFVLNTKHATNDWMSIDLSPDLSFYTLENLKCGSVYHIYLLAQNRVGNGSPSTILTVSTKGGRPKVPKADDIIATNSTALQLNLYSWPNGGCPIAGFSILYKEYKETTWKLIAKSISEDNIVIQNLIPATWYQVKISAENDAGTTNSILNCATTTLRGGHIPMPTTLLEEKENPSSTEEDFFYQNPIIIISIIVAISLLIFMVIFWIILYKKRRTNEDEETAQEDDQEHHCPQHHEDTTGRGNRRKCQKVYITSPMSLNDKLSDDLSGKYDISPYATFSMPGPNNSRSVTTSTLDYSIQFKTFGHKEDGDHNSIYPSNSIIKHWHKNSSYSNKAKGQQNIRMKQTRLTVRRNSESDDTSGSFYGDGPSGSRYRAPVKQTRIGATGYETVMVTNLFRSNSSTESNEVSPPLITRKPTPRHLPGRKHLTRTSCSSSEEEEIVLATLSANDLKLQPPHGFTDNRELSKIEYDRGLKLAKHPLEVSMLERYDEHSNKYSTHLYY